jgi:transposase-like protein
MLSITITPECVEAALAAGELACPGCSGSLSPWGFACSREVRLRDGARSVRPRRARCQACKATHVLAPAWLIPRRRDATEVIGEALRLAAGGVGHRVIARRLGRPAGTVRGWLRASRLRAPQLRGRASRWAVALDAEIGAVTPAGSELGDAVEAIMLAVRAWVLKFGPANTSPWERAVCLTAGLQPTDASASRQAASDPLI